MDRTYLVFGHRGARYGLDARAVREIVRLPALSPIEEMPPYIAGVFNLRGRIVPVMDLGLRFGHARESYRLSDGIIVIESADTRVGIVVNEVHDVATIAQAAIEGMQGRLVPGARAQFVSGEAKLGDSIAMLLDVDALLNSAPQQDAIVLAEPDRAPGEPVAVDTHDSVDVAQVFGERARSLAQQTQTEERAGLAAFAVIGLGGELFGLDMDVVREFAHVRSVVPVPCCPPHIVGNMNLRGDILTLVDIRPALGMAVAGAMSEVVVVRSGELLLGFPAAEIVDVVYLTQTDIASVPVASDGERKAYCSGVATIGSRAISILDVQKILAARELQVAETVQ